MPEAGREGAMRTSALSGLSTWLASRRMASGIVAENKSVWRSLGSLLAMRMMSS